MADDPEPAEEEAMPPDTGASSANEKAAERTDRLANGLERLAYKFHDFGNWLMGFLR